MAVPNPSTPISFEGAAAAALRLPEIAQYEYHDDVTAETVNKDLKLLETAWNTRLTLSIADEAKRTNSWSLLWKMEAAIVSLQRILAKRILAVAERAEREAKIPGLSKLAQKVVRQSHESVPDDAAIAAKMRDDPALVDQWYARLEQKAATRNPSTTSVPITTRVPRTTTGRRVQFETGTKSTGTTTIPHRTQRTAATAELAAEQERARFDIEALRQEAISEIAAQRQAALADIRPVPVSAAAIPVPAAAIPVPPGPALNVAANPPRPPIVANAAPAVPIPAPVPVQVAQRNYYDLFNIFDAAGAAADLVMEHLRREGGAGETAQTMVSNESVRAGGSSRHKRTGGATLAEEAESLRRLDRALMQTIQQSDTMFSEMKRWVTSCGGDFDIPCFVRR